MDKKALERQTRVAVVNNQRSVRKVIADLEKVNNTIVRIEKWYEKCSKKLFQRYHTLSARRPPIRLRTRALRNEWRKDRATRLEFISNRIINVS